MTITYTLKILELEVIPLFGTYTNVVNRVHSRYEAINDQNIKAFKYYSQNLSPPSGTFIEFNELTKEILDQWLEKFYNSNLKISWDEQLSNEITQRTTATNLLSPPWE